MQQVIRPGDLEGQTIAAVDIGSNSFHMIIARVDQGQIAVLDRLRESVRMAAGLSSDGRLDPLVRDRALDCLARFGQRLRSLDPAWKRAVATNSVRQLSNPRSFLMTAETALGTPIEVVAGREEARLIYVGVAQGLAEEKGRRLVIDIGGGSTELIIGKGFSAQETESTQMGCVASTKRFFADGKLTAKRWQSACAALQLELAPTAQNFINRGWKQAYGASGTMRAISGVLHARGGRIRHIDSADLRALVDDLIKAGGIDAIRLKGLSEERRAVFLGGVCVLCAVFEQLQLEHLRVSDYAMREGILYDLIGRSRHEDPCEASVKKLAKRYGVDQAQERRVWRVLQLLYDQVRACWGLDDSDREMLSFASRTHEVGLAIAHSQHHRHGAYILANTDLPGFSRQQQQRLANLVGHHRRSLSNNALASLSGEEHTHALRLLMLLRLAVLLNRSRTDEPLPELRISPIENGIELTLNASWLRAHPLTRADLDQEKSFLKQVKLELKVVAAVQSLAQSA